MLDTLGGFHLEERGPVTLKVVNISFPFYQQIIILKLIFNEWFTEGSSLKIIEKWK